ncbi:MAG: thioredoxin family protein [Candidatus Aminicenantales bacterium]
MREKTRVSCLYCGATNQYPLNSEGKRVVCGRCRNELPPPGEVLEPPVEIVLNLIKKAKLPLLLDFYSPTCAPCHMMHTVLENLAKRRAGELMALKLNVDSHPQLAARLGIKAVPTFVVVTNGNERGRTTGAMSETDFSLWVASIT